jgi:hypothetical protein
MPSHEPHLPPSGPFPALLALGLLLLLPVPGRGAGAHDGGRADFTAGLSVSASPCPTPGPVAVLACIPTGASGSVSVYDPRGALVGRLFEGASGGGTISILGRQEPGRLSGVARRLLHQAADGLRLGLLQDGGRQVAPPQGSPDRMAAVRPGTGRPARRVRGW